MGKINRNDHENHTLQGDTFLKTVFKLPARLRSCIFYIIWDISFNAIAYSIYLIIVWKFSEFSWVSYANTESFQKYKKRNTFLRRNTNEMKVLNIKRTKLKTYRGEMSFWLMKMTLSSESLHLRRFVMNKEIMRIKINNKTHKVYKIKNGCGSYQIVSFFYGSNYSIWCGLSSNIKISKFETILIRDSTLHIKKTFQ